jgi:hypothetical protein
LSIAPRPVSFPDFFTPRRLTSCQGIATGQAPHGIVISRIHAEEGKVEAASCRLTCNDKRRGRRFYFTRPLQRGFTPIVTRHLMAEISVTMLETIGAIGVIGG